MNKGGKIESRRAEERARAEERMMYEERLRLEERMRAEENAIRTRMAEIQDWKENDRAFQVNRVSYPISK